MPLRINALKIENVGCFKEIDIRFHGLVSIICGENGIGKTTILEAIAALFSQTSPSLTRNANAPAGVITFSISTDPSSPDKSGSMRVDRWLPEEARGGTLTAVYESVQQFVYIKSSRDLFYSSLSSVRRDPDKQLIQVLNEINAGLQNADLKDWFVNRFMFFDKPGSLTDIQIANYKMAIACISVMDPSVRFATVDADTFNIMVETNDGIVPLEFLSSGYRTTFYTILGMIKEIEFRKLPILAKDFTGAVIIDEIDLHLHPTWQREIARVLRTTFPSAQFIMTTHSPHVIQAAASGEVIALVRDDEGRPVYNPLPALPYGFQGWTVEEILEDVMRVPTTKSPLFEKAMQDFDKALSEENPQKLAEHMGTLEQMLHPSNPLRKLLRLQAAPVLG